MGDASWIYRIVEAGASYVLPPPPGTTGCALPLLVNVTTDPGDLGSLSAQAIIDAIGGEGQVNRIGGEQKRLGRQRAERVPGPVNLPFGGPIDRTPVRGEQHGPGHRTESGQHERTGSSPGQGAHGGKHGEEEAPAPAGVVHTRGRAADFVIYGLLIGILGYLAWQHDSNGRPEPAAGGEGIRSLAVLPFEDLMNDPGQAWFAAGMLDSLIGELSNIEALHVISRTSAMRYADSNKSIPEIARELGVDAVVEGSVFRDGETVRISVQLIEAQPDRLPLLVVHDGDRRGEGTDSAADVRQGPTAVRCRGIAHGELRNGQDIRQAPGVPGGLRAVRAPFGAGDRHDPIHRVGPHADGQHPDLTEPLAEAREDLVLVGHPRGDLVHRVDDRRVVAASEEAGDRRVASCLHSTGTSRRTHRPADSRRADHSGSSDRCADW